MRKLGTLVAAAVGALAFAATAQAQDWPTRPVTMVVPFAAGGPVDTLGRILALYLGETIGKQVVIENVSGAGGMSGSLRVSQAAPDGYMFVLGSVGTHALNQTLYKKPLYNTPTDFAPVALIADAGLVLITRKDLAPGNLPHFIAYAKANQGKMQFGSGGAGTSSHIGCVLLNQAMAVDITHVPYRGGGPALADLIAGRVDYICNIASTVGQAVEARQVKAIAALTPARSPILPDLPSAHEQGLKDFDAYTWNAVFLPKGTPAPLVDKLNDALRKVMDNAAFRARLHGLGLIVVAPERRSPEYLQKFVVSEIEKWAVPIQGERREGGVGWVERKRDPSRRRSGCETCDRAWMRESVRGRMMGFAFAQPILQAPRSIRCKSSVNSSAATTSSSRRWRSIRSWRGWPGKRASRRSI